MKRKTLALCGLVFVSIVMTSCVAAFSNMNTTQGPTLRR